MKSVTISRSRQGNFLMMAQLLILNWFTVWFMKYVIFLPKNNISYITFYWQGEAENPNHNVFLLCLDWEQAIAKWMITVIRNSLFVVPFIVTPSMFLISHIIVPSFLWLWFLYPSSCKSCYQRLPPAHYLLFHFYHFSRLLRTNLHFSSLIWKKYRNLWRLRYL